MFEDNPSKVFRPEDVGLERATENHRTWFRGMRQQAESMREQGDEEEAIYEHMLNVSREAGEPEGMVMEILYPDGSSLLPLGKTTEDVRDDMIVRFRSAIEALEEKVRLGDAEAIQLTKELEDDIASLEQGRPA